MNDRRGAPTQEQSTRLVFLGLTLIVLAFLVLLHQYLIWGYWWESGQHIGLHHEAIALWLVIAGLVLIMVSTCQMRG